MRKLKYLLTTIFIEIIFCFIWIRIYISDLDLYWYVMCIPFVIVSVLLLYPIFFVYAPYTNIEAPSIKVFEDYLLHPQKLKFLFGKEEFETIYFRDILYVEYGYWGKITLFAKDKRYECSAGMDEKKEVEALIIKLKESPHIKSQEV